MLENFRCSFFIFLLNIGGVRAKLPEKRHAGFEIYVIQPPLLGVRQYGNAVTFAAFSFGDTARQRICRELVWGSGKATRDAPPPRATPPRERNFLRSDARRAASEGGKFGVSFFSGKFAEICPISRRGVWSRGAFYAIIHTIEKRTVPLSYARPFFSEQGEKI